MGDKVYCKFCRFCEHEGDSKYLECIYPENIGNWFSSAFPKTTPNVLNKDNDCKWYKDRRK